MNSDEKIVGGAFIGLLLFGWFVWMLSKVVASVFRDLGIMFDAIGSATVSFLAMAWALAQLAAILSAGAAVVYAAYRHYQLTRQATEIMAAVEARCNELAGMVDTSQKELEKNVSADIERLRRALAAALAKPEAAPDQPKALPAPAHKPATIEVVAVNESATPRVSNPY